MKFKKYFSKILIIFLLFISAFIRFYDISNDPPGLYIDEINIGYNAHTILTKGVDEYGVKYPLVFRSLDDYKLPVYIYLTAASEAVFGENELAVRFPSALAGTLLILVIYLLLQQLLALANLQQKKEFRYLPIVSAFLLAISPWLVQFSRGGFEVNVALFFYITGLYFFFLYWNKKNIWYLLFNALFLVLTFYTYFVYRVLMPVTIVVELLLLWFVLHDSWKRIISFIFVIFILCLPTLIFSLTQQGMARFSATSAFSEYPTHSFLEKLYVYPMVYIKNYLSYFSPSFLFVTGDGIGRHQMPWFGIIPKWQFLFLLTGLLLFLRRKKTMLEYFILGLALIAPVAASFAAPSPHTLRSLPSAIPLTVLTAYGVIVWMQSKKRSIQYFGIFLLILGALESITYVHFYFYHYPGVNALDWGGAYKQMVQTAATEQPHYDAILVDQRLGASKYYFGFFDPGVKFTMVDDTWKRPKNLEGKKILYIRPSGIASSGKLVENIYIPKNVNNDVFAQFWEMPQ